MNKTLLIIVCDFLLISILALVEFKPNLESEMVDEQTLRNRASEEMLELLQLSLEHESAQREAIASNLEATSEELEARRQQLEETSRSLREREESLEEVSQTLQERESEKEALSSTLEETLGSLELTLQEKTALAESLQATEERSSRLQQELRQQQELAGEKESALRAAQERLSGLETEQQQLSTRLQIRETEKQMLEQNLVSAQAEVERARIEVERAQQRAENLAAGVTELAATSTALQEEFRQAQPLSHNAIYKAFENNRVYLRFQWEERAFLSTQQRQAAIQTLLVDTGEGVHVVFATANTPFSNRSRNLDPAAILTIGERSFAVREIGFLQGEPSIAAIRVPQEIVEQSGLRVFPLSMDPFRFSNAILVSDDREAYGEIPVRVPPGESGYLEVESRLINRLFGEFSPRPGNYVFSLTGELIGISVSNSRAHIIRDPEFNDYIQLRTLGN